MRSENEMNECVGASKNNPLGAAALAELAKKELERTLGEKPVKKEHVVTGYDRREGCRESIVVYENGKYTIDFGKSTHGNTVYGAKVPEDVKPSIPLLVKRALNTHCPKIAGKVISKATAKRIQALEASIAEKKLRKEEHANQEAIVNIVNEHIRGVAEALSSDTNGKTIAQQIRDKGAVVATAVSNMVAGALRKASSTADMLRKKSSEGELEVSTPTTSESVVADEKTKQSAIAQLSAKLAEVKNQTRVQARRAAIEISAAISRIRNTVRMTIAELKRLVAKFVAPHVLAALDSLKGLGAGSRRGVRVVVAPVTDEEARSRAPSVEAIRDVPDTDTTPTEPKSYEGIRPQVPAFLAGIKTGVKLKKVSVAAPVAQKPTQSRPFDPAAVLGRLKKVSK